MSSFAAPSPDAVPIEFISKGSWPQAAGTLPPEGAAFAAACGFEAKPGQSCLLPGRDGALGSVLFGVEAPDARGFDPMLPGKLATALPKGVYRLAGEVARPDLAALSWLLSGYRFTRYKDATAELPRLCAPEEVGTARLERIARGIFLARDLVNTPANDLGPEALEAAALSLAVRHGATTRTIRGEKLEREFPLIHAVGQAAAEAPRLVEITWGPADAPKVTLVGKGVTFDTGGLDIKPESGMALMKKDMAGAATALGLADMVMDAGLNLRLRVLLPIVENAISAPAFRPGDIYRSRKGITVEIGNTDAEGRLILADALALACEDKPDLVFDFATLTGAARVALGPDLPALYSDDAALAAAVEEHGSRACDPVWRMPLWRPYEALLDGKIADVNNISGGPFAGSITAALFLSKFVDPATPWAHFDLFGWNPTTKPGRPEGGEAPTARLLFDLLTERASR